MSDGAHKGQLDSEFRPFWAAAFVTASSPVNKKWFWSDEAPLMPQPVRMVCSPVLPLRHADAASRWPGLMTC